MEGVYDEIELDRLFTGIIWAKQNALLVIMDVLMSVSVCQDTSFNTCRMSAHYTTCVHLRFVNIFKNIIKLYLWLAGNVLGMIDILVTHGLQPLSFYTLLQLSERNQLMMLF